MTERFLTKAQAAEILGLPMRRVYEMMRDGVIESWCINPESSRKQYMTTMGALGKWQAAAMVRPEKKRREVIREEDDLFEWVNGKKRIKRRRA